jgi:YVTN family beta-propeller protein
MSDGDITSAEPGDTTIEKETTGQNMTANPPLGEGKSGDYEKLTEESGHSSHISRRVVIAAAAWSVPVVTLAVATPAFAASANAQLTIAPNPLLIDGSANVTITITGGGNPNGQLDLSLTGSGYTFTSGGGTTASVSMSNGTATVSISAGLAVPGGTVTATLHTSPSVTAVAVLNSVNSIFTDISPVWIAFRGGDGRAYVANGRYSATFAAGTPPQPAGFYEYGNDPDPQLQALAVTPDNQDVYAISQSSGADAGFIYEFEFNGGLQIFSRQVGSQSGLAMRPNSSQVYITDSLNNHVLVLDTSSHNTVATIDVSGDPYGIAITPNGSFAYVATINGLVVINTSTNGILTTIGLGGASTNVVVLPNGNFVYVALSNGTGVAVVSTSSNSVVAVIPVAAWGLAASPDSSRLYVGNQTTSVISTVDTATNSIIDTFTGPAGGANGLAVTPDGTQLWVAFTAGLVVRQL